MVLWFSALMGEVRAQDGAREGQAERYTFVAFGVPLSEAFDAFIQQSEINIAFEIALVAGKEAFCRAVDLTAEASIQCLLRDTGLDFIRLSSGTYVLIEESRVEAQWGGLAGVVVDEASGEPLVDAHVLLADAGIGDVTGTAGRFVFPELAPGPHRIVVSYLGYDGLVDTVRVEPDQQTSVTLGLQIEPFVSTPIVVNGISARVSADRLETEDREVGTLLASSARQDLVRSLNTIAGVRVGDALADVHVQGGRSGDHQYRLDGAPVFVPIPYGGIVGPFSPFALNRLTVHKAGFSVAEGSQLSGVIAAEHTLAQLNVPAFDIQADPLSLNARAMGSIGESGVTANWMVAARKSLWSVFQPNELASHLENWGAADLHILNSLVPGAAPDAQYSYAGRPASNPLQNVPGEEKPEFGQAHFSNDFGFHDVHGALRIKFDPLSSLHASFYSGGNQLGDRSVVLGRYPLQGAPQELLSFENSYDWDNTTAQVRYERVLGNRTFADWSAWYSGFDGAQQFAHQAYQGEYRPKGYGDGGGRNGGGDGNMDHGGRDGGHGGNTNGGDNATWPNHVHGGPADSTASMGMGYNDLNRISEIGIRSTVNHALSANGFLTLGLEAVRDISDIMLNLQGVRSEERIAPNIADMRATQFRVATYLDHSYGLGSRATLDLGVRLTYLDAHQQVFAEPRVAFRYDSEDGFLGPWAFRSSVGLFRQYVNQFDITSANRNALAPGMRFWLPLDASQRPSKSIHLTGALAFAPASNFHIRLESYYKHQPHLTVIDYANSALFADTPAIIASQQNLLATASGFAYGLAVSVERNTDAINAKVQYEYSVAEQRISNRFDGRSLPTPWNVPHRIQTSLSVKLSDNVTLRSRLENRIGQSWAFRGAYYNFLEPNPALNTLSGYDLSNPSAHKLPVATQLDFGVSFSQKIKNTALQVRFDLANILSEYNVEEWNLVYNPFLNSIEKVERPLTPFIPSVALRLGF